MGLRTLLSRAAQFVAADPFSNDNPDRRGYSLQNSYFYLQDKEFRTQAAKAIGVTPQFLANADPDFLAGHDWNLRKVGDRLDKARTSYAPPENSNAPLAASNPPSSLATNVAVGTAVFFALS